MAVYGPVQVIWQYMDRSIYCHMTLSAMNYLLFVDLCIYIFRRYFLYLSRKRCYFFNTSIYFWLLISLIYVICAIFTFFPSKVACLIWVLYCPQSFPRNIKTFSLKLTSSVVTSKDLIKCLSCLIITCWRVQNLYKIFPIIFRHHSVMPSTSWLVWYWQSRWKVALLENISCESL